MSHKPHFNHTVTIYSLSKSWLVKDKAAQVVAICLDMSFVLYKINMFTINVRLGTLQGTQGSTIFLPSINSIGFQLKKEVDLSENVY